MGNLYQFKSKKQIEEVLIKKEHQEFIKLLQFFVENIPSKYELLKIIINNGKFTLQDKYDVKIVLDNFNDDYADALINTLVNFSPEKIEIVQCDDSAILEDIKNIFGNRVIVA